MNLHDLNSGDIKQILKLREKIEALERQITAIIREAQKRRPQDVLSGLPLPRKPQPSLRDLVSGILGKSDKPMSVPEIYEATLVEGYQWRSQEPINALNVKMYTDRTFKKVSPGLFVLRRR